MMNQSRHGSRFGLTECSRMAMISAPLILASPAISQPIDLYVSATGAADLTLSSETDTWEIEVMRRAYDLRRAAQLGSFFLLAGKLEEKQSVLLSEIQRFVDLAEETRLFVYSVDGVAQGASELRERSERYHGLLSAVQKDLEELMNSADESAERVAALLKGLREANNLAMELKAGVFQNIFTEELFLAIERIEPHYKSLAATVDNSERERLLSTFRYEVLLEAMSVTLSRFGVCKDAYFGALLLCDVLADKQRDELLAKYFVDGGGGSFTGDSRGFAQQMVGYLSLSDQGNYYLSEEGAVSFTLVEPRATLQRFVAMSDSSGWYPHGPQPNPDMEDFDPFEGVKSKARRKATEGIVKAIVGKLTGAKFAPIGLFWPEPLNEGSERQLSESEVLMKAAIDSGLRRSAEQINEYRIQDPTWDRARGVDPMERDGGIRGYNRLDDRHRDMSDPGIEMTG